MFEQLFTGAQGDRRSGAPRERILGHPVDPIDRHRAVEEVVARALTGESGAYVCLNNVHTTVESQTDEPLRAATEGAFLSVPDGMPLVWILRRRGHASTQKVTGIEYMPAVASAGRDRGLRHYLFGGGPGVAEKAAHSLQEAVPGALVVGSSTPPFGSIDSWDLDPLREDLRRTRPHVLWVGLGAPKQEIWMARVAGDLDVPMMVGVGACFDFLAGTKRTAPRFVSGMGLEWLFRLVSEPRRLWRRYLVGNSKFLWMLARNARAGNRK